MDYDLSLHAARVLGCLVEKELATPEYYPLTLNALVSACNQKSNRDPVLSLTDDDVLAALEELRQEQLSYKSSEGVRAVRFCHNLPGALKVEEEEQAILAVLLLRGPQTQGELRTRCERLHNFADLAAVEAVLQGLQERTPALVTQLPRQPGRKEHRYAHLLSAQEALPENQAAGEILPVSRQDRLSELETELAAVKVELADLQEQFARFRAQFE